MGPLRCHLTTRRLKRPFLIEKKMYSLSEFLSVSGNMSRFRRDSNLDCKVYVGDLPRDASEKELERAFSYYGPLRNVWVARNPPGFAFVEFEDPRDADDATRGLDGT